MPKTQEHAEGHDRIGSAAMASALLAFYFLYALLRIQMQLVYQAREPVFFFDWRFARDLLIYPGGVNELCSRFYLQFYYYPWTGAVAMILLFGAIAWGFRQLLQSLHPRGSFPYVYWVPSVFLIALHGDYTYPVVLSLGVLWVVLGVWVYVRLAALPAAGRAGVFCLLQALLYYITAGQAFLFTLTILGYELLYRRRIVLALFYAAFGAILPYIGGATLFAMHLPDAYTTNLTFCGKYRPGWASWALYACVPLLPLLGGLDPRGKVAARGIGAVMVRAAPAVVLAAAAVGAAMHSYDQPVKRILSIDYYAQRQDWKKVLALAGQSTMNPDYIQFQANRALYHRGLLGDDLFDFVQHSRTKNLFISGDPAKLLPLQCSDVFFDLGLVNEAQHWAHEATSVHGYTPGVLQRLAEVNLLKGEPLVATKYLAMLDRTLWFRGWAKDRRRFLADPNALLADPRLGPIKAAMPKTDFIIPLGNIELCLTVMMDNPGDRMVFEYFMAKCLMEYDLATFVAALPRLAHFGYTRVPRHFEEAICICLQVPELRKSIPAGMQISRETLQRFSDFNQILAKYKLDRAAARRELLPYRDTFWFYVQYYYPAGGS